MKRVRIRSFCGPYFSAFRLNTEKYGVTSDQDSYKETLTSKKRNVVIFGDSIPVGINTNLNINLIRSKAFRNFFLGASSNNFINCIKPTLQNPENSYETAILHMGVNDLLKRGFYFDVVSNNIMNIANEYKTYGIKNIFVLGLRFRFH